MKSLSWISILTNCLLFSLSSEQMMILLPSLFSRETDDGDQTFAMGSGRFLVFFCFERD